jgi:hypothetical protein
MWPPPWFSFSVGGRRQCNQLTELILLHSSPKQGNKVHEFGCLSSFFEAPTTSMQASSGTASGGWPVAGAVMQLPGQSGQRREPSRLGAQAGAVSQACASRGYVEPGRQAGAAHSLTPCLGSTTNVALLAELPHGHAPLMSASPTAPGLGGATGRAPPKPPPAAGGRTLSYLLISQRWSRRSRLLRW